MTTTRPAPRRYGAADTLPAAKTAAETAANPAREALFRNVSGRVATGDAEPIVAITEEV
jgi:hypothetical protein